MSVAEYRGVTCLNGHVSLFGIRLDVYSYLADGFLIDTGPSRLAREFTAFFDSHRVEQVLLTHHHEDHSGNAAWLASRGLPVYIHKAALDLCRQPARLPLYRRIFWGSRRKFEPLPLPASVVGEKYEWQVLEAPGHSADHVALYCPAMGAVFSGDLFVSQKIKVIMRDESIPAIMKSLRLIHGKEFSTLYCAHAGVVESGRERVKRKLEFLEELVGTVLDLHKEGLSVGEIDKKLHPKKQPIAWVSCNEWSSEHIVRSIIREMT